MWFILLAGCAVSESPEFGANGSGRDTGYVGGSPEGSGGDDDSGPGDSGAQGETGEAICDADDLEFVVLVEDGSGDTGTVFTAPADITTRAVFTNPCDGLLRFTTPDGCLVDEWVLTDGTGNDRTSTGNCVESETTWSFAALEGTSITVTWGALERSTYQIAAQSPPLGRTANEFFSVQ